MKNTLKLFHLSDLHIGLKLINQDLSEDQIYIFDQIAKYAKEEQPDVIMIAGDIYDKAVPSAEAVELFDDFAVKLSEAALDAKIMMISGNHDSAPRVNAYRYFLKKQNLFMIGIPPRMEDEYIAKVTVEDQNGPVHFYLLPFVKPSMVKNIVGTQENGNNLSYDESLRRLIAREEINTEERNVLVSHQFFLPVGADPEKEERMDSEIKAVGNIDCVYSDMLDAFDYVALGHIHKPMKVGSEVIRYCGTPLACSVSEAGQQKGIIMVEMGPKGKVDTKVLPLKPMREVKIIEGNLDEVLTQSSEDYVTVVLTDQIDFDVFDLQDRLHMAFPNLLEIRRENIRKSDYKTKVKKQAHLDPFTLCCDFIGDSLTEDVKEILANVISTVQGVK